MLCCITLYDIVTLIKLLITLTSKVSAHLMINLYRKQKFRGIHSCWIFTEEEKHLPNKQAKLGTQPYL